MTMTMFRCFTSLLVCLALTSCSPYLPSMTEAEEIRLFAQGLDQYIATGNLSTLKLLPQQYPKGEWRARTEKIINTDEQLRQQQARFKIKKGELEHSQAEKAALAQEIQALEKTLEQLKQVLIDMELRAK